MRNTATLAVVTLLCGSLSVLSQDKPKELAQDRLPGQWTNIDEKTGGVKRVVLSKDTDGEWAIEAFGSGGGGQLEIPWGKVDLHLLGSNIGAKSLDYGFASWDKDFAITHTVLHVENNRLVVEMFTIFKDDSGRSNYRSREVFKRSK